MSHITSGKKSKMIGSPRMAFTFIELLIVIVIIGILAVLSMPQFQVLYDIRLNSAAKKIASDLRYAQNMAMAQRKYVRVVFTPTDDRYDVLFNQTGTDYLTAPLTRAEMIVDFDQQPDVAGVNITSAAFGATGTLMFDWNGIPKDGNGNNITSAGVVVLSYQGNDINVEVIPQTGKITIVRP